MKLKTLLVFYFRKKGSVGGHAMSYRDPALKNTPRPGSKETPIIRQVDIENCFEAFGEYSQTVERVMELKIVHELSPTAIADRARREKLRWPRSLSRRNMLAEMGVMETSLEDEAERRGLIG